MERCRLPAAYWRDCRLSGCKWDGADLRRSRWKDSALEEALLRYVNSHRRRVGADLAVKEL